MPTYNIDSDSVSLTITMGATDMSLIHYRIVSDSVLLSITMGATTFNYKSLLEYITVYMWRRMS